MVRQLAVARGVLCVVALAGVAGCTTAFEGDRIDYRSENRKTAPKLEVPPDLVQMEKENRYSIPELTSGVATASGYNAQQGAAPVAPGTTVAPNRLNDMHIERAGTQRWLVVKQTPEALWPKIREFWQDNGFLIDSENAQTGVMETDWAENRAKIPQDFIRNTIGKVFDSLYSTGERDRFRTRLERGPDGTTEIYISHRGAQEVLTGSDKETATWTSRPSDPGLETEFLARLMARLGGQPTQPDSVAAPAQAKAAVVNAAPSASHAKLVGTQPDQYVEIDEGFERAWRRVGLVLDRAGFTVEDRDRAQGVYFVRYFDNGASISSDRSLFARMFSGSKDKKAQRYRVVVKGTDASSSHVTVQDSEGKAEGSPTGTRILSVIAEQLK